MPIMHIIEPLQTTMQVIEESPSLEELQKLVGGYIEVVNVIFNGNSSQMIINEEGKLNVLPYNAIATKILQQTAKNKGYINLDYIVGTAIILEGIRLD